MSQNNATQNTTPAISAKPALHLDTNQQKTIFRLSRVTRLLEKAQRDTQALSIAFDEANHKALSAYFKETQADINAALSALNDAMAGGV